MIYTPRDNPNNSYNNACGCFVEVCWRRGLKVNAVKNKVMVLGGKERLEFEVCIDGIHLEHVSEFKYLRCGFGKIWYR